MTLLSMSAVCRAITLAGLALSTSVGAQPSGYHFETTPGPRGIVRLVPNTPGTASKARGHKAAYKFVLPPNGRAGAYYVQTKPDDRTQSRADGHDCGRR